MEKEKKTLIVCAYEKTGKSYFTKHYNNSLVLDADYRNFKYRKVEEGELKEGNIPKNVKTALKTNTIVRNAEYPDNYFKYIQHYIGKVDVILLNTNTKILKALIHYKMPFLLIYPKYCKHNLEYYIDTLHIKDEIQEKFKNNFKTRIQELDEICKSNPYQVYKIKNSYKEHIINILEKYYDGLFEKSFKCIIRDI